MALSSLHGLLDLLTSVDNDVNPETVRSAALLGLMLVSTLEDDMQKKHSDNALSISANTR
ncbi:hypothetical protein EF878_05390 [Dickeya undicola]|uniref:Uncharacterized protein n=2 Tax=Dickeya undicola TaxID=1577887 RepID=A0A3N0G6N5_9GAMM|nr:hypothetical protein EF878_05390 [Dickeya undicola]